MQGQNISGQLFNLTEVTNVIPGSTIQPAVQLSGTAQAPVPVLTDIRLTETTQIPSGDTVAVPASDTIQIPPPDTVAISLSDTIQIPPPDTVAISLSDTIQILPADTVTVSLSDTIQIPPPDSGDIRLPDTTPVPATVILPVSPDALIHKPSVRQAVEVKGSYTFDPSWYLASEQPVIFTNDKLFPALQSYRAGDSADQPVFIDRSTDQLKRSAIEYTEYLRSDHDQEPEASGDFAGSWIPGLVILSLLLLTWVKIFYVQFLSPVLISAFKFKEASKLYYERSNSAQNAFVVLELIFAINGGLFLYFIVDYFNLNMPGIGDFFIFLILSGIIVALFALRFFAINLAGFLFDVRKIFSEYRHSVSLYNKVYGILLLPVIAGLLYLGEGFYGQLIYGGIIIGGAIYFLQLIRGIEIIIKKEFSVFYLILYLCAFEIIPILVLYKLIQVVLI